MKKRPSRRDKRPSAPTERQPCVAGLFYPAERRPLEELLHRLWERKASRQSAPAVLVPHGPFRASGSVSGAVFSTIRCPESAVVVGPDHSGLGRPCSLEVRGLWMTPLGPFPVDEKLARRILEAMDEIEVDSETHSDEHSVEAVLPFLQREGSVRRFVPVAVSAVAVEAAQRLGRGLAEAVQRAGHSVLLVASAHLTRYESREVAQRNDSGTLERILAMDPEGLLRWVGEQRASMCGSGAVAAVLVAAKALGASAGHLVKYEIQGSQSGQAGLVNGYAGVIFR